MYFTRGIESLYRNVNIFMWGNFFFLIKTLSKYYIFFPLLPYIAINLIIYIYIYIYIYISFHKNHCFAKPKVHVLNKLYFEKNKDLHNTSDMYHRFLVF
jgi:hypothetical protein